jgi:hypothetical protein
MSRSNRERRRLRQEQKRAPRPRTDAGLAEHADFLRQFEKLASVPEPSSWPGVADPVLARPDLVKLALAQFATEKEPGRSKCRELKRRLADGVLQGMPDLDHWAMEEFVWHGLPGDPWRAVDAFLEREKFSPAAADQLRRWQQARIGFFEVGAVRDDRLTLREWDPLTGDAAGPDFQAIALNIGGVNFYRDRLDDINLTYVAPWAPDEGLFCAMGYGLSLAPEIAPAYLRLLGLRQPEMVARPLPWKTGPDERRLYAKTWRQRNWPDWLAQQLVLPFKALAPGPERIPKVFDVLQMLPCTPEEFETYGLYFEMDFQGEEIAVGATALMPVDLTSPNDMPLAEYRAYRDLVGPPKAVR